MNLREDIINKKSGIYYFNLKSDSKKRKDLLKKTIIDILRKLEKEKMFSKYNMTYLYSESEDYIMIGIKNKNHSW